MTSTMTITRFGGTLGAVLEGIDANTASEAEVATVRQALLDHHVVVLPGQELGTAEHEAFMARFGPLHFHPFQELVGESPTYSQTIEQTMDSMSGVDRWHTDLVFAPEPVAFGSLHCLRAPDYGGGTEFVNLIAAYEQLDEPWKTMVNTLSCEYELSNEMLDNFCNVYGQEWRQVWMDALNGTVHPLVRTHPESGLTGLYLSPNTRPSIVGMDYDGARAIIDYLTVHSTRPNLAARWTWSDGDLLIWDERCTLHYGVRDGYPGDRKMRRVLVNGDRPYFAG